MVQNFEFDKNENPNFVDMFKSDTINEKGEQEKGIYIKGEHVIYLDAPKVNLSVDTPLLTEAQDIVGAINELKKLSEEKGGDDWQPPDWWIPVPEPEPYDIYILVLATKTGYQNTGMNFSLYLRRASDNETGHGHVHCDWGDGKENDFYPYMNYSTIGHTYAEEGQYLVRITGDENANFYVHSGSNQSNWQIFKAGEKIVFVSEYYDKYGYDSMNRPFVGNGLKLIQVNSPKGLPMGKKKSLFQNCGGLKKIKLRQNLSGNILDYTFQLNYGLDNFPIDAESVEFVNKYAFQECHGLKTLSLPNVTSIGFQAFFNCDHLESIYLPNCTFVEDRAFENCYSLQKIVLAEDCTFGTDCFDRCFSLYPRPDGSTN